MNITSSAGKQLTFDHEKLYVLPGVAQVHHLDDSVN
jgi:hypothetical protein